MGKNLRYFRPLAQHLQGDNPIYGLSIQLRETPGKITDRVETLAAHYVEEMQKLQPQGPYFLMGFSFGGMVAFEMAQQLVAQGQEISQLVLIDTYTLEPFFTLSPAQKMAEHWCKLQQEGLPYLCKKSKKVFLRQWRKLIQYITLKIQLKFLFNPNNQGFTESFHHKIFRQQNRQARRHYVPNSYPGKATIFRARDCDQSLSQQRLPDLGWRQFVQGGLEIYDIPGNHLTMLQEPHVKILAQQLDAYLKT